MVGLGRSVRACHIPIYLVPKKVKLFLCLTKHHAMRTYWGVEV